MSSMRQPTVPGQEGVYEHALHVFCMAFPRITVNAPGSAIICLALQGQSTAQQQRLIDSVS